MHLSTFRELMKKKLHYSFSHFLLLVVLLSLVSSLSQKCFAQVLTQSIRGQVINKISLKPIAGAHILLFGTNKGVLCDQNGNFILMNVPIGRQSIICSNLGFETLQSEEFILISGKEFVLNFEMSEKKTDLDTFNLTGQADPSRPVNESAFVSARSFGAEDTERIPAAINDPGRMAIAFPGVMSGTDESENKVFVRGNTSYALLWRIEGVDIPNPNHFAAPGAGGGGIPVFSGHLLGQSDFFTGGMPAEYGNTLSGAFDIHFRKGSTQKKQYRVKAGVIGIDLATEGPIKKNQSSYLINYRYSTLGLLSQMGFYLAGDRTINAFHDLSFNLVFQSKDQRKKTTLFGITGFSDEHHLPVEPPTKRNLAFSEQSENRKKPANMGAFGLTHTRTLSDRSSIKYTLALVGSDIQRKFDTLNFDNEPFRYDTQRHKELRIATNITYQYQLSSKTKLKSGIILNLINYDFLKIESSRNQNDTTSFTDLTSFSGKGFTQTGQGYTQLTHAISERLSVNTGVHILYLFLNRTSSVDPRISFQYRLPKRHTMALAYGIYSQLLPLNSYFYTQKHAEAVTYPNRNLSLPRSHHFILSYRYHTLNNWKLTFEAYYQYLQKIPVESENSVGYSMLNYPDVFLGTPLISKGKGKNRGLDISIEKFFTNDFYCLISASAFKSNYKTVEKEYYNSVFNRRFSSASTFGKEFRFKNSSVLQAGTRILYGGGFRYTPSDIERSVQEGRLVLQTHDYFANQLTPYFRIDTRLSYRSNKRKYSSILSLDIQNATGRKNYTAVSYNQYDNLLYPARNGSGIVPVLSYQIDF